MTGTPTQLELASDCSACSGLCCVALQFEKGPAFAESKPVGRPCTNLRDDDACSIHARLRESGWAGCTVFECFGAGQRLTAAAGSWREHPAPGQLFTTFSALQATHEMLFLLRHAPDVDSTLAARAELYAAAERACDALLSELPARSRGRNRWAPVDELRSRIGPLLSEISAAARGERGLDLRYHDLAGRSLRGRDLRGGTLRGATLCAADLSGLDLSKCDLLGADLRDADLRGARLDAALFLTQPQVNAANGNAATTLPTYLDRPAHWA